MDFAALKTGLLSVFGLAISTVACVAGCGGTWEVPKEHFDGVNHLGYVTYWDKIAEIDIGEDAPFPIVIGFQSNRETSSPYLGYGWVMPLLESSMVQTGENTFEIMKPTGYTSGFGRDPKSASAIGGVQGWKGEIGSDTIKVWAPCGWSLSYTRGKLTEIGSPKGKRIVLKRALDGLVEDVSMDGRVLVKVLKGFGGRVEGFEVDGKKLAVNLDEKPRIQNIQEKNVIIGRDFSLGRVETIEGQKHGQKVFEYGLTDTVQPKIICMNEGLPAREIVWDAVNKRIVCDGLWKYQIQPALTAGDSPAIARMDAEGRSEFRQYKASTGEEVSQKLDGSRVKTTWFVSGTLAGRLRAVEKYQHDELRFYERYSYDEKSNLLRIDRPDARITFKNGSPAKVIRNGALVWSYSENTLDRMQ